MLWFLFPTCQISQIDTETKPWGSPTASVCTSTLSSWAHLSEPPRAAGAAGAWLSLAPCMDFKHAIKLVVFLSQGHIAHTVDTHTLFNTPKAMASIFRTILIILYRYRSQIHDEIPITINVPSQNLFTREPCLGDIRASCFSHVTSRGREPKCLWQVGIDCWGSTFGIRMNAEDRGATSGGDSLGRLWALALELGVCWIHCTLNASWCYPLVMSK